MKKLQYTYFFSLHRFSYLKFVYLLAFLLGTPILVLSQNGHIIGTNHVLRLESTSTSNYMSFYHNNNYKGYLWATGNNMYLTSLTGNVSLFGTRVGIGTSSPGYKLDVIGDRIRVRNSSAAGARTLMMRTDGAAVDLHSLNADLFLRAEGNDININPFTSDGVVWVNGTTMASGANVEEFNVVGSDMNLEDVDPYIRFVRTGTSAFNVGGLDFKEGSSSKYRLNYDYVANKLFFSKGFAIDGTEDITIDGTTGDLDVRRNIFFGSIEGFKDGGAATIEAINGAIHPTGDGIYSLGASGSRWSSVWAVDGSINTSDRRLKTNIRSTVYGLNEVMKMKPVAFEWKNSQRSVTKPQMGFVAQDLLEVVPEVVVTTEMVKTSDDGEWVERPVENLGVKYSNLIPILTKAIQEQQAIINRLEARIATLENK